MTFRVAGQLYDLSVLPSDSFFLLVPPEQTPVGDGREFGFDAALEEAVGAAFALDWASNAPNGTSPAFELPIPGSSTGNSPDLITPNEIAFLEDWGYAKPEGVGGGGDKSGGGGGGGKNKNNDTDTTDPTPTEQLLTSYTSKEDSAETSYNVQVDFLGDGWTTALQEDFVWAADYISSLILADIQDVRVPGVGVIDDVLIQAQIVDIDGSGGILGRAGPTSYRTSSYLPATGIMEFDIADAEDFDALGLFDDIVLHEMIHSIGFGTMWDLMGLVSSDGTRFLGDLANTYDQLLFEGDGGGPLVETDGGPGTAGGHWDEASYGNELMTGYINGSNELSMMSVAALEDMGYDTVLDDPNNANDQFGDFMLLA